MSIYKPSKTNLSVFGQIVTGIFLCLVIGAVFKIPEKLLIKSHIAQVKDSSDWKAPPNPTREEVIDGTVKEFAKTLEENKTSLKIKMWALFIFKTIAQLAVLYLFSCRVASKLNMPTHVTPLV